MTQNIEPSPELKRRLLELGVQGNPVLVARRPAWEDSALEARAPTRLTTTASVRVAGYPSGHLHVELFRSLDERDRGGLVLRITTTDPERAFIVHPVSIEGGCELHLAGTSEASALLRALVELLRVQPRGPDCTVIVRQEPNSLVSPRK